MATVTSFFCKVDFEKKTKPIFYDNENLKISDFFSAFVDFFYFWSYFSLVNTCLLQTNMTLKQKRIIRRQKKSDVRFYTYKTGRMIGINSKNFEVTF